MSEPGVPPTYTPPPPPPPTGPSGSAVSPNRNVMIVLSYLWILFLIPLITEKNDPEVQWHAKHGLVLFLAEIIAHIAIFVLRMALNRIGFLGCVLGLLGTVVWLGFLVIRILCILKGLKGERLLIPGVSQYADRF